MERRWGIRKSIEFDVVIDNQPRSLLRGQIGNVSIGGLFVRTEPSVLTMNAQVELVLMLQQEDGTRVYRMPAIVVRLTPHGAGLMFDQYDVNAFRTLVVLLLAEQRAAGARAPRARYRPSGRLPLFTEDGASAASILEGTAGNAARAAAPAAPVSPPLSPVYGESH